MLLLWRVSQLPRFGDFEIRTITAGTMALAFLAMAQAVVVISGGIDLSVGSMMVFANCLAALWMEDQGLGACWRIAVAVLLICGVLGTVIGLVITASGVPDIIVTLAASFVLAGLALFVIGKPGGGTSGDFQRLVAGGLSDWYPSVLWIVGALVLVWLPLRRSRLGPGDPRRRQRPQGRVPVRRRGRPDPGAGVRDRRRCFAGFAGLVVTASTGGGEPRATIGTNATLNSVAAVVLGGVALTGGVGGLVGPVLAVAVPDADPGDHARPRLGPEQRRDGPRRDHHPRGPRRRPRPGPAGEVGVSDDLATTDATEPTAAVSTAAVAEIAREAARPGWRVRLAERPTLVLAGVFAVLYAVTAWQDDSLLTAAGVRSILLLSCPLAIFAASQTLCMLTGGIDLSIAMTANLAAYVAAVESGRGTVPALAMALGVGLAVGFVNGLAIGAFRVNPLIMTLGMASVLLGIITVGLRGFLAGSTNVLPFVRDIGSGRLAGPLPTNLIVWAVIATVLVLGLRSTGLGRSRSTPSATTRSPAGWPGCGCGRCCWRCT